MFGEQDTVSWQIREIQPLGPICPLDKKPLPAQPEAVCDPTNFRQLLYSFPYRFIRGFWCKIQFMTTQESPSLDQVRILVVDDHPNTASTLARSLAQLGSRVDVISAA